MYLFSQTTHLGRGADSNDHRVRSINQLEDVYLNYSYSRYRHVLTRIRYRMDSKDIIGTRISKPKEVTV